MKIKYNSQVNPQNTIFIFLPEKFKSDYLDKNLSDSLGKKFIQKSKKHLQEEKFTAKTGESLAIFGEENPAKKVYFIGVGNAKKGINWKKSAGTAIKIAKKNKSSDIAFLFPSTKNFSKLIIGAVGADYEFKIGDTSQQFFVKNLDLVFSEKISEKEISRELKIAESINQARQLVNLPPNILTTSAFVSEAQNLAKKNKNLKITILDQKKLQKLEMGGILAVGKGSDEPPYIVILEYLGGNKNEKPTALVGKGVCFDSGGYNLKPTSSIKTMKMDMGGAGTVFSIMKFLAEQKVTKNVIGVMGLVENMINGKAYRPDDIITMYSGQTCHITNTDAEGRLVLADCLSYITEKYDLEKVLDFATLTGACIAALGNEITGIMGNNDQIIKEIENSAKNSDEDVWQLPITDLFREKIKEEFADLQNWTAGVSAGSSMAGAFLENFVRKTPWAHFDIAGTAWSKSGNEFCPKGGTGAIVETVCRYLEE